MTSQKLPYKLDLVIQSATNLFIGLIDTNNPPKLYVDVLIDGTSIGTTATVSENPQNPKWYTPFNTSLQHVEQRLTIKILLKNDEIKSKKDELLSEINIDLSSFQINKVASCTKSLFLANQCTNHNDGTLNFSVILKRNRVIQFRSILPPNFGTESALEHALQKRSTLIFHQDRLHELRDLVEDLKDLNDQIGKPCVPANNFLSEFKFARSAPRINRVPTSGTLWDPINDSFCPGYPMGSECSIMLYRYPDDEISCHLDHYENEKTNKASCVQIIFLSRPLLWLWLRWLRTALAYWRANGSEDSLPEEMLDADKQVMRQQVRLRIGEKETSMYCWLKLKNFYKLIFEGTSLSFDLNEYRVICLSHDSGQCAPSLLQVQRVSIKCSADATEISGGAIISADRSSFRSSKAAPITSRSYNDGDSDLERALSTLTTSTRQSSKNNVNILNFKSDSKRAIMVLRVGSAMHVLRPVPGSDSFSWNEPCIFDLHDDDYVHRVDSGELSRCLRLLPPAGEKYLNLHLFVGEPGQERHISSKAVPVSSLTSYVGRNSALMHNDFSRHSASMTLNMDTTTELVIELKSISSAPPWRFVTVTCDLVGWNGEPVAVMSSSKIQQSRSTHISSFTAEWRDCCFRFDANHGLSWAQFVRFQVYTGSSESYRQRVGVVYIRVNDVESACQSLSMPLLLDKSSSAFDTVNIDPTLLHFVMSFEQKIVGQDEYLLNIDFSVGSDGTKVWPAEVLLRGDIDLGLSNGEVCSFKLHRNHISLQCAVGVDGHASPAMTDTSSSRNNSNEQGRKDDVVIVEIYENHYRAMIPPFKFAPRSHSVKSKLTHFSDETGQISMSLRNLNDYPAPQGYEWIDSWLIDMWHTCCDYNGWSYGSTFQRLREKLYLDQSSDTKAFRRYRRRRWVRTARKCSKSVLLKSKLESDLEVSIRAQLVEKFPTACLAFCRERVSFDTTEVLLPWCQIHRVNLVTPSILSISFTLHKFVGVKSGEDVFREVDLEAFVWNCPAADLARKINERSDMANLRYQLIEVLLAEKQASAQLESFVSDDIPTSSQELSLGCKLLQDLEEDLLMLQREGVSKLERQFLETGDENLLKKKMQLECRVCRFESYIAFILDVSSVLCPTYFSDSAISSRLNYDFKIVQLISGENTGDSFVNKLQYLLSQANIEIRDLCLRGWLQRNGLLEYGLEVIANEFLVEMSGLLGRFFDGAGQQMRNLKGLNSKNNIIGCIMKFNDYIGTTLRDVLRPYDLIAMPESIGLTLYCDFNLLVSWYASLLILEMTTRVDSVVEFWRDPKNRASEHAEFYEFPLPWIPQRRFDNSGPFITNMPERVREQLNVYMDHARVKESLVSDSLKSYIVKLDEKVIQSYANGLMHLVEHYSKSVKGSDWTETNPGLDEEHELRQLEERLEWLCSVANDLYRLQSFRIANIVGTDGSSLPDISKVSTTAQHQLDRLIGNTIRAAMDHASCILFRFWCSFDDRWLNEQIHQRWIPQSTAANQMQFEMTQFESQMKDVSDLLEDKMVDRLEVGCWKILVTFCASKFSCRYIHMLRIAHISGRIFYRESEFNQITLQVKALRETLLDALGDDSSEHVLADEFRILDLVVSLLKENVNSPVFTEIQQKAFKIAKVWPSVGCTTVKCLVELCILLRGDLAQRPTVNLLASKGRNAWELLCEKELMGFQETLKILSETTSHLEVDWASEMATLEQLSRIFSCNDPGNRTTTLNLDNLLTQPLERHIVEVHRKNKSRIKHLAKRALAFIMGRRHKKGIKQYSIRPSQEARQEVPSTDGINLIHVSKISLLVKENKKMKYYKLDVCVGDLTIRSSLQQSADELIWQDEEFTFPVDRLENAVLIVKVYATKLYGKYQKGWVTLQLNTLDITPLRDICVPLLQIGSDTEILEKYSLKLSVQLLLR